MFLVPSLSEQQNFAVWGFALYLATFVTVAVVVGMLGAAQRRASGPPRGEA